MFETYMCIAGACVLIIGFVLAHELKYAAYEDANGVIRRPVKLRKTNKSK